MFVYNIHTPSKTFALPYKEDEAQETLIDRILGKLSLQKDEQTAIREKKDGAGLVYEFENGRWSLDDDDDLKIFHSRLPPDSTSSATLHLNLPHPHAHFAPPAYTSASSAIKAKTQKPKSAKSIPNGDGNGAGTKGKELGPISGPLPKIPENAPAGAGTSAPVGHMSPVPQSKSAGKAQSFMSTKSRRSKYGDDNAEPLGEVIKREWLDFQSHQGVRTVMGRINNVAHVRMLLKAGYRHVYVSRSFAIKHKLVDPKYAMGAAGYTGLKTLGPVSITVGSRTATHPAYINEEEHFDVVLGRSWLEKMGVKTDPFDQTALTYMDSGEVIPCDLVVLKGADGNVITIT